MDWNKIEALLDKFIEAGTNLQEEQTLANAFRSDEVPAHLVWAKIYFEQNSKAKTIKSPALDWPTDELDLVEKSKPRAIITMRRWFSIAAVLLMFVLAYPIYLNYTTTNNINTTLVFAQGENMDEKAAYEEARKALMLISSKLKKGTDRLQAVNRFDEIGKLTKKLN